MWTIYQWKQGELSRETTPEKLETLSGYVYCKSVNELLMMHVPWYSNLFILKENQNEMEYICKM